jgi:hypothetical protein
VSPAGFGSAAYRRARDPLARIFGAVIWAGEWLTSEAGMLSSMLFGCALFLAAVISPAVRTGLLYVVWAAAIPLVVLLALSFIAMVIAMPLYLAWLLASIVYTLCRRPPP